MISIKESVRTVLLLASIYGCASSEKPKFEDNPIYKMEQHLARVENQILRAMYFTAMNDCFSTYAVCLAEGKSKNTCWPKHEQCVINVDKQYKGKL